MSAREWIFVAIAVLAVYLVFQLIRALQVKDAGSDAQGDADTLDADAEPLPLDLGPLAFGNISQNG